MTFKVENKTYFKLSGFILFLWAFSNTYLDIKRYGIDQGYYFWFCNLALWGIAIGLFFKQKGLLIGFCSIASYTQVFWLIDNCYRLFNGKNLMGLAEFLYQPGFPMDEFLLAHYHYFTIPIALIGIYFLKEKKSNALLLILFFNPLIFLVSYFAFPSYQNINCIYSSCFSDIIPASGKIYSILFWGIVFVLHVLVAKGIEFIFNNLNYQKFNRAFAIKSFSAALFIGFAFSSWDIQYYSSLPKFKCKSTESEAPIFGNCRYTLDWEPSVFMLSYEFKNKSDNPQVCRLYAKSAETELLLEENVLLMEKTTQSFKSYIQYPKKNLEVELVSKCTSLPRLPASTRHK